MTKNDKVLENMVSEMATVVAKHQQTPVLDTKQERARNLINEIIADQKENPNERPMKFLADIRHYSLQEAKAIHQSDASEKDKAEYRGSLEHITRALVKHEKNAAKLQSKEQMFEKKQIKKEASTRTAKIVAEMERQGLRITPSGADRMQKIIENDVKKQKAAVSFKSRGGDVRSGRYTYPSGVLPHVMRKHEQDKKKDVAGKALRERKGHSF